MKAPISSLLLFLFSSPFAGLAQDSPPAGEEAAEEENAEQLLTLEQRDNLVVKLEAIEQGFLSAREARHQAAFEAFEKVIDNDLALYNFYKECVERTNYSDEDRVDTSRGFEQWSRNFDEQTDRASFANMLRMQVRWLFLLKRTEVLIRSAEDEGMQLELELAPEFLALCKQALENYEDYGEHFLDLRKPATSSALSQAFGLDDLETGMAPSSPLDYQTILLSMVVSPAKEAKNVPVLINGWNELARTEKEFIRIRFEINKDKQKRKREGRGNRDNRDGDDQQRSNNFEDSEELENFQQNRLPQLIWRREMDRFDAGDQLDATKNLYNHMLSNPEHPNFRNWNSALRSKIQSLEFEEEEVE